MGFGACRIFSDEGLDVNMTLCFNESQALLAAKAGARFVSPFIGRLDDIGLDGTALIDDMRGLYDNYPAFNTEILAASIRSVSHITLSAQFGADAVTVPLHISPDGFTSFNGIRVWRRFIGLGEDGSEDFTGLIFLLRFIDIIMK